jgi:hypothetical protein
MYTSYSSKIKVLIKQHLKYTKKYTLLELVFLQIRQYNCLRTYYVEIRRGEEGVDAISLISRALKLSNSNLIR